MTDMTHPLVTPLIAGLGPTELLIIVAIIVLLFGAKKLPELARGSGRALRIFKAETKGLLDDDDDDSDKTPEQRQIDAQNRRAAETDTSARPIPEDPGTASGNSGTTR
jgi:sec-independent protein translocase protein TatA